MAYTVEHRDCHHCQRCPLTDQELADLKVRYQQLLSAGVTTEVSGTTAQQIEQIITALKAYINESYDLSTISDNYIRSLWGALEDTGGLQPAPSRDREEYEYISDEEIDNLFN